jgi:hypothetical protein
VLPVDAKTFKVEVFSDIVPMLGVSAEVLGSMSTKIPFGRLLNPFGVVSNLAGQFAGHSVARTPSPVGFLCMQLFMSTYVYREDSQLVEKHLLA